jgi:hypothetical protein
MLLDILDDVFLLYLPLEPAEGAFDRLTLLDFDFSHATYTPFGWQIIGTYPDAERSTLDA